MSASGAKKKCGAPGNRAAQMSLTLTLSRQREREFGCGRFRFPASVPDSRSRCYLLSMYVADTIVAHATAPGMGAVAIVRLSGPRAFEILDAIFRPMRGGELAPR